MHSLHSRHHTTLAFLPPITVHYYTCDLCEAQVDATWPHIAHRCPAMLQHCMWAFVRLLPTAGKEPGAFLVNGLTLALPASNRAISVAGEPDSAVLLAAGPLCSVVYSP
jgi:hypothetical protein